MNLPIGGWLKQHLANDSALAPSNSTTAYAAGVGFKMPYVVAWGEYDGVARSDGTAGGGASITVMPRVPGVGELIIHPGLDTAELRLMDRPGRDHSGRRIQDLAFACSQELRDALADYDVTLVAWEDVF